MIVLLIEVEQFLSNVLISVDYFLKNEKRNNIFDAFKNTLPYDHILHVLENIMFKIILKMWLH